LREPRRSVPPAIDPRLLILACTVLETGTGLALLVVPRFVVRILLGAALAGAGVAISRLCGLALIAFGLACWPEWEAAPGRLDRRAVRALVVYNAAAAGYLSCLLALDGYRGVLLVPAIAIHAILAVVVARMIVAAPRQARG
jgi:hypothetical protein